MQLFQIMILRQTSPRIPWFHRTHLRIRNSRLLPSFQSPQNCRLQRAQKQSYQRAQKGTEAAVAIRAEAAVAEGAEAALAEGAEAAVAEGAEAAVAQGARGKWSWPGGSAIGTLGEFDVCYRVARSG